MVFRNVLKYALIVCVALGLGFDSKPNIREEVEKAAYLLPTDVSDVGVMWQECGTWNGFYYYRFKLIVLCKENMDEGLEIARIIYLHELGHAYTIGHGVPFDRWDGNYEAAADEFSAIMSIVQRHPEDVLKAAVLYDSYGKSHPTREGDPHPAWAARAKMLWEIYMGYTFPWSHYGAVYRESLQFWRQQLLEHP